MARSATKNGRSLNLKAPSTAAKFRAAAKAYTLKATRSRGTAIKTLKRAGILTPKGHLSRHYAPKA